MKETFEKVQRSKCLFHSEVLGATLNQLLTILEEGVRIHELEPCQQCLNTYGHDEIVYLHHSIKTVYDAVRMIQVKFKQLQQQSGWPHPRFGTQSPQIGQTSERPYQNTDNITGGRGTRA
jgi:hypothetical protein